MGLLLTIDIGNTNTVLGVHEGAVLKAHWRLTTRREQTADEYGILVRSLFASSGLKASALGGVALLQPFLLRLQCLMPSLEAGNSPTIRRARVGVERGSARRDRGESGDISAGRA